MALAAVMQDSNTREVSLKFYCRNEEKSKELNETHQLKGVTDLITFNERFSATTSVAECVKGADFIFLCIPAQTLAKFFKENKDTFEKDSIFVNCAKGMLIEEKKFISELFVEIFPDREDKYTVLSGPSFAAEIYQKMPTCVTIASKCSKSLDE